MEEPHYLCGIAAGRMSKTGKIGFIGSKPLFFIFNNCNGFVLGARSVHPDATCRVVHHRRLGQSGQGGGSRERAWPIKASTSSLQTSMGRRLRSKQRSGVGIYSCGYHTDQSTLAPKGFLTGAEWNWAKAGDFVKAWQTGGTYPNLLRGGFKQNMVAISPFGSALPENVRQEVLKARQGFIDDTLKLYKGPLKDNEGKQVLAAGQEISNTDNEFKVNVKWLAEGAIGQTGFEIAIAVYACSQRSRNRSSGFVQRSCPLVRADGFR